MSSGFPCPNPTCTHVFAPGAVTGAASLTCPLCGTEFHFRQAAPEPARTAPGNVPAEGKLVRRTAPVRQPPQTAATETAENHQFAIPLQAGHVLRSRRRKRPWWHVAVAALVALGLLTIAGLWISRTVVPWMLDQMATRPDNPGAVFTFKGMNCRFTSPGKDWRREEAAKPLGVFTLLTLQRSSPIGWLVLAAQDFKTRAPRDAEVVDDNIQRLALHFQNLETTFLADEELAGQRAQHLALQGRVNQVLMTGDCYLLAYKGIVYCLAVWGPAESARASREEFHELIKGFALLKEREGWTEEQPEETPFDGHRAAYSLRGLKGLWEEYGQPEQADPKADLVILAKDRLEEKQVDKMAQITVMLLGPQKDLAEAAKAARAHVEEQHKRTYPATTMAVTRDADGAQDRDMPVGNAAGHVADFHVKNGKARERFVVLAVVQQPDQAIAIQCECDWKRRNAWEADFKQVLRTFQFKEK